MKRLVCGVALLAACSNGVAAEDTTTITSSVPETTTTVPETTTTPPPPDCPEAPYEFTDLPLGVGQGSLDTTELDPDVWTSVAGTRTTFVPRSDDTVAIALIRGTLPAVEWPDRRGEVSIDGTPAVVGPHLDGSWVAGWFEQPPDRCNLYTMVFYPPWNPTDVEAVIEGMNRVGG